MGISMVTIFFLVELFYFNIKKPFCFELNCIQVLVPRTLPHCDGRWDTDRAIYIPDHS